MKLNVQIFYLLSEVGKTCDVEVYFTEELVEVCAGVDCMGEVAIGVGLVVEDFGDEGKEDSSVQKFQK